MRTVLIAAAIAAFVFGNPVSPSRAQAQPAGAGQATSGGGWTTGSVLLVSATAAVAALALDIYTGGALTAPLARAGTWLSETLFVRGSVLGRAAMRPAAGVAAFGPAAAAEGSSTAALEAEAAGMRPMRQMRQLHTANGGRLQVQAAESQRPGCYQITVCAPRIRPVDPEAVPEAAPPR